MNSRSLYFLCPAALLLTACPLLEFARSTPELEVEQFETSELDPEEVDEKLRRLTICREDLHESISGSWARYQAQVGKDGKPKRQREGVYLRTIEGSAFRRCDAITEGAIPPELPEVEAVMAQMVLAAREYTDRFREIASYLDEKAYEQDDWARLAVLHPLLEGTHRRWAAADDALVLHLFEMHGENDPKYLERLEERGEHLQLSARALMVQARPLAECIASPDVRALGNCEEQLEGFENAWLKFKETHDARHEEADSVFWMSTFTDDGAEYRRQAKAYLGNIRSGRARPREQGDLAELYAAWVRDANTLDFSFH
jgi:hypothetical protein